MTGSLKRTPLTLEPGDTIKVSLAEEYDRLKRFVEKSHPVTHPNRVKVRANFAGYDDGTG